MYKHKERRRADQPTRDSGKLSPGKRAVAAFVHFVEYHPPARLSRNLRRMLLEFLLADGAVENLYLMDLLHDLEGLFQLLDEIESGTTD